MCCCKRIIARMCVRFTEHVEVDVYARGKTIYTTRILHDQLHSTSYTLSRGDGVMRWVVGRKLGAWQHRVSLCAC